MQNTEKPAVILIRFSLPLILSGILQQLYSWADALIVGRVEGDAALAAVGSVSALTGFFIMSITGFTLGVSILSAHRFGQDETQDLRRILSTFALLLGGVAVIVAAAGLIFSGELIYLLDTPEDMLHMSLDYLRICLLGVPFLAVYNTYAAVLRAMGDSKASFFAVLISALANVALDILFVAVLSWGVVGAAIATVIAQALMAVFIIIYAPMRHKILRAGIKEYRLHRDIILDGARLGLPPMIQSCITSAGNLILQGFMNSFGSATVAAITAAYRVDSIILLPVINLGSAISTMTAQSRGAGKPERIRQFFRTGAAMAAGISLILSFTVFFFGGALVSMFGIHETSIAIGGAFFRRLGSFYIFFGIGNSLRGALEGTGDVFFSSVIGIASLGLRVLFSFVLVGIFDNMVIAFAEGFSWIGMVLMYALRMYKKRGEMGFKMPNTQ